MSWYYHYGCPHLFKNPWSSKYGKWLYLLDVVWSSWFIEYIMKIRMYRKIHNRSSFVNIAIHNVHYDCLLYDNHYGAYLFSYWIHREPGKGFLMPLIQFFFHLWSWLILHNFIIFQNGFGLNFRYPNLIIPQNINYPKNLCCLEGKFYGRYLCVSV